MEALDPRQDESWRFDFCRDILAQVDANKQTVSAGDFVIEVACPGCGAEYSLDEARVPAGGHSMRCPKCSNRFLVGQDGSVSEAKKPRMATMVGTPGSPGLPPVPKPPAATADSAGASEGSKRKFAKTQMGTLGDFKPAPPNPPVPNPPAPKPPVPKPGGYKPPSPGGVAANKPPRPAPPGPPPAPPTSGASSKRKFAKTQMGTLGDFKPPEAGSPPAVAKKAPIAPPVDVGGPGAPDANPDGISKKPIAPAFDDADLPAPAEPRTAKFGVPPASDDLPARVGANTQVESRSEFEDLPAAVKPGTKRSFGKTQLGVAGDFEAPNPSLDGISLPPAEVSDAAIDPFADLAGPELSLPPVSSASSLDDEDDLPLPKFGDDDLPVPGDLADLPAPGNPGADLPVAAPDAAEGNLPANVSDNLPTPSMDDAFGEIELPGFDFDSSFEPPSAQMDSPDASLDAARSQSPKQTAAGFGDLGGDFEFELPPAPTAESFNIDMPPAQPLEDNDDAELDLGFAATGIGGPAASELNLELEAPAAGGSDTLAYGEIDLGLRDEMGGGELDLELEGPAAAGGVVAPAAIGIEDDEEEERRQREAAQRAEQEELTRARAKANARRRKSAIAFVAVLAVIGVVGVSLQFVPGVGLFGRYQIEQYLPEAGSPAAAKQALDEAHKLIEQDTYAQARAGLKQLAEARRAMGLNKQLLSHSVIEESLYVARFGDSSFGSNERVSRSLQRIDERGGEAPDIHVARAASFLAKGDAKAALDASSGDASVPGRLVQGEAAFLVGDAKAALAAYQAAAAKRKTPRTQWGLARALLLAAGASDEKTVKAVEAVLTASPSHVGARVVKAHALEAQGKRADALTLLREATGQVKTSGGKLLRGSAQELSDAWTAYGLMMVHQRNRPEARKAFERALKYDPFNADALIHGGDAMLADARYADAFELFQRALTLPNPRMGLSRPARDITTEAELGAARAMIETQRTQEAINKLTDLAKSRPEDVEVLLWLGKAYQKAEQPAESEPRFREVITLAPENFEGYMALAQLFFHMEDPESASEVLKQAKTKVEESAQMRRLLGESELARGYLDAAEQEFRRALELDPDDLGSQFFLGVVLRKRGKLEEAAQTFDAISKIDSKWPGLAIERGRVFEEKGEASRAVKMYQEALQKNPRDLDLRLRLGAAQVSAGNLDEAETNLSVVLKARPDSAEAEHFLGRIALERGNYESASARFKNASDLDPTQFAYFTYLAKAELGRGHITAVGPALKRAEELDPNDPTLFLLRGRLGVRTGAVRDAIRDLQRAVELNPELVEAYSHMGSAYAQLGDSRAAINAYQQAAQHEPDDGQWYFKLGELFMNADRRADAMRELRKAAEAGQKLSAAPAWLAETYRLLGDGERLAGNQAAAKKHYLRYLEIAPASAMDRDAVAEQLEQWGVEL